MYNKSDGIKQALRTQFRNGTSKLVKSMYSAIVSIELFKAVQEEKRKRSNMTVGNNGHYGKKM